MRAFYLEKLQSILTLINTPQDQNEEISETIPSEPQAESSAQSLSEKEVTAVEFKTPSLPLFNKPMEPNLTLKKETRREKQILEEKERVQRKFDRLVSRIDTLKKGKPEKWRKVQTLLNQTVLTMGGEVKKGKATGSGRRIHLGDVHSGFHRLT